jgi:hypothetical protein
LTWHVAGSSWYMTQSSRRSELTFGSMENPVQHVGRHRRFAYQSHKKTQ